VNQPSHKEGTYLLGERLKKVRQPTQTGFALWSERSRKITTVYTKKRSRTRNALGTVEKEHGRESSKTGYHPLMRWSRASTYCQKQMSLLLRQTLSSFTHPTQNRCVTAKKFSLVV